MDPLIGLKAKLTLAFPWSLMRFPQVIHFWKVVGLILDLINEPRFSDKISDLI